MKKTDKITKIQYENLLGSIDHIKKLAERLSNQNSRLRAENSRLKCENAHYLNRMIESNITLGPGFEPEIDPIIREKIEQLHNELYDLYSVKKHK